MDVILPPRWGGLRDTGGPPGYATSGTPGPLLLGGVTLTLKGGTMAPTTATLTAPGPGATELSLLGEDLTTRARRVFFIA